MPLWRISALAMMMILTSCASGDLISRSDAATPPPGPTLKLVSLNLFNRPWRRAERLEAAAAALAALNPDVVLLQEVAQGWILPGDPVALLSERLGLPHAARHWHERNLGVFKTGLAVLSRFPIASSEYHEFDRTPFWDAKGYQLARTAGIRIVNVHMASTGDDELRRHEWQELTSYVQAVSREGPVVLGGDLNTLPGHESMRRFRETTGAASLYDGWPGLDSLRTWTSSYQDSCASADDPESALLDYFWTVPGPGGALPFAGGRIIAPQAAPHPSDHCPVFAEIRLK